MAAKKKKEEDKKQTRSKSRMFNPKKCPFCAKQKRDDICMTKHLISHHWKVIRAQNQINREPLLQTSFAKGPRKTYGKVNAPPTPPATPPVIIELFPILDTSLLPVSMPPQPRQLLKL